jgi:hypothetical protein
VRRVGRGARDSLPTQTRLETTGAQTQGTSRLSNSRQPWAKWPRNLSSPFKIYSKGPDCLGILSYGWKLRRSWLARLQTQLLRLGELDNRRNENSKATPLYIRFSPPPLLLLLLRSFES